MRTGELHNMEKKVFSRRHRQQGTGGGVPRFDNLQPSSPASSRAKRKNGAKDTAPERLLRQSLWKRGLRYRLHCAKLPGKPDIVFASEKIAVFCDGDFWHGRDWESRQEKLKRGANASYWLAKIESNRARDTRNTLILEADGWTVLRFWEGEIRSGPSEVAERIAAALARIRQARKPCGSARSSDPADPSE
jgi:DNA mismatch endonuclease (patch repair protein)